VVEHGLTHGERQKNTTGDGSEPTLPGIANLRISSAKSHLETLMKSLVISSDFLGLFKVTFEFNGTFTRNGESIVNMF
jgi:hypothetical protein